ncbi:TPA: glycosyltransferase family 4 protein [Citrobacter freundii]|nr:glycosyltransferase family 4 protein [Citrobacter sp. Cf141]HAU5665045.1 glycosyltransferase family 4 protein [Citrobacter freundii]MDM3084881.1 glycosyltransferase family 4 protein [Citrobacter sp. Cf141]HBI3682333.1 glycosyltransferase family 4 protein [Citrobacter freundii]HCJ7436106.1 glycosyltransferase family 4 protein [Citrobacter freundii]HCK3369583.1 glycosyltransferase family 4 protein [Citrobacter freundii]
MKKIAHVLVLPKMAGSQKFCHLLMSKLTDYKKYVLVSACEDVEICQRNEFINAFEAIGVEIIWCKHLKRNIGKSDIFGFVELFHIFKKYEFDIVHTNSTKPGIIARIAARISGIKKIVHTVHGTSFYKGQPVLKRFIYWAIEGVALQFGDVNVCVNKYYLKYYKFFFWKNNITIYNGYDFSELECFENNESLKSEGRTLLFVGRLDKPKNPLMLIKAYALLASKHPRVHLNIVGDGELRRACENLVSSLGITDQVTFHGWVEKPYAYYMNCDVFVCPSLYEAFGFTFIEAAYFKKPILASNVEGIPEVVIDKKMGFLVDPHDYHALSEKMEQLINSPQLLDEMGEFSHNYVKNNFSICKSVNCYRSLYESNLKRGFL